MQELLSPYEMRGIERGEERAARRLLLQVLRKKFSGLTDAQGAWIEVADAAWCEERLLRAVEGQSPAELDLA